MGKICSRKTIRDDLDIDGSIILKRFFKRQAVRT
jgi:hypothetical protein